MQWHLWHFLFKLFEETDPFSRLRQPHPSNLKLYTWRIYLVRSTSCYYAQSLQYFLKDSIVQRAVKMQPLILRTISSLTSPFFFMHFVVFKLSHSGFYPFPIFTKFGWVHDWKCDVKSSKMGANDTSGYSGFPAWDFEIHDVRASCKTHCLCHQNES